MSECLTYAVDKGAKAMASSPECSTLERVHPVRATGRRGADS